jgi:hypothetical protein
MAIEFAAASDEYIDCGSGATLDDIAAKSVAFWVNVTSFPSTRPGVVKKNDDAIADGWIVFLRSSGDGTYPNTVEYFQYWSVDPDGLWTCPLVWATGTWYHIVITYNNSAGTNDPVMYVNGVAQTVTERTTPGGGGSRSSDASRTFRIGSFAASLDLDGLMEDVRIFDRIISAEEAAVLAAGYRGPLGGEAGWWSLGDAQVVQHWDGDSLATTDVIPDMSGNGNDGTPTNTPTARASDAPRFGAMLG